MLDRVVKSPVLIAGFIFSAFIAIFLHLMLSWNGVLYGLQESFKQHLTLEFSTAFETDVTSLDGLASVSFEQKELHDPSTGFGEFNRWYHLNIKNADTELGAYRLVIDNPTVDNLTIYQLSQSGVLEATHRFGDNVLEVESSQRILPNIPFQLAPDQSVEFYAHVQTNGSPLVPFSILQERSYEVFVLNIHLVWGAFLGLTLMIALYNTVLFLGLRDTTYLHYIGYLMSVFAFISVIHGFGYYLIPDALFQTLSRHVIALQTLVALSALNFGAAFLNIKASNPPLYRWVKRASIAMALFALISIGMTEAAAAPMFAIAQLTTYLLTVSMVSFQFRSRFRWTRYYLVSWVPFFVGAAIGFMLFSGILEYSFITRHALLLAIMFEITLISMGLADRMGETERQRLFQATHDLKTGLPNDFYIDSKLRDLLARPMSRTYALIGVNISNYEYVAPYLENDKRQTLLIELANSLTKKLQTDSNLVPLDSEQEVFYSNINNSTYYFLVTVNQESDIPALLTSLSKPDNFNPIPDLIPFRIHCVFSASVLRSEEDTPETAVNSAMQCLNMAAKQEVPYVVYQPNMKDLSARGIRLAQDLEVALDNNNLTLYHQPQLHLQYPAAPYSEVLVRWKHPELGFISPTEFVAIAEQTGLIRRLTLWVIEEAFRQFHDLSDMGRSLPRISINVSANDLSRSGFPDDVHQLVRKHDIRPDYFTLEVTETSHQADEQIFKYNILQFKKMGFMLAIDDYGTGYSSLTYISEMPFDEIKIDQEFVQKILNFERQEQIIEATVDMAVNLGLKVTAEGVENEATLTKLKTLQCHKIQGYFYAKAMPLQDYVQWLHEQQAFRSPGTQT